MEQEQIQGLQDMWAVVELFGHNRIAGKLSTINLGAACLLRVDVPEVKARVASFNYSTNRGEEFDKEVPAWSRLLGVGAIYAINPCSEKTARAVATRLMAVPVNDFEAESVRMLPVAVEAQESEDVGPETLCLCGHARKVHAEDDCFECTCVKFEPEDKASASENEGSMEAGGE